MIAAAGQVLSRALAAAGRGRGDPVRAHVVRARAAAEQADDGVQVGARLRADLVARELDAGIRGQLAQRRLLAGEQITQTDTIGKKWTVSGSIDVQGGRLRYLGLPHTLEQIDMKVTLLEDDASIDEFRA